MKDNIIFHIDVNNAFLSWTAVLLLKEGYKEDIRKIPSIIGGDEKKRKGIVLAKSPVAKKFGIVTAEPIYQAKKKCPTLQMFSPNFSWYYKMSRCFVKYLENYTPNIEQYSIDECFLDMTGTNYLYNDYEQLAYKIKDEIYEKFGFTVNVGIGNNKLCAKMASDFEKPNKVHTLYNNEIKTKMWPLPVDDLFMVGKKSSEILHKLNINTIGELAKSDERILSRYFKDRVKYMKEASNGIDYTKVEKRSSKNNSISTTETLSFDTDNEEYLKDIIFRQVEEVARQLREQQEYARTVAIIYKNSDFKSYSAQSKLENASNNTKDIYKEAIKTFDKSYKGDLIRLVGVRLADLVSSKEKQLNLFDIENEEKDDKEEEMQKTVDMINKKFGNCIIAPASLKIIGKSTSKKQFK